VIVTEPTLSGLHDLQRVVKVGQHFGIEMMVIINKFNINLENTVKIENWCEGNNVSMAGKIHFDNLITEAMVKGLPVVEYSENSITQEIKDIWERIKIKVE